MTRVFGLVIVVGFALVACSADQRVVSTDSREVGSPKPPTETTVDGPDDTTPTDVPVSSIVWAECDDELVTDPAFDCGTLAVPLDPEEPSGDTITIAMVRLPAVDPDTRIGPLLFNPGGPGGSGFDYIAQAGNTMVNQMGLQDFDLIGFDPRGVDRSNGIRCLTDEQVDATVYLDTTPDTPEEQAALDASDTEFDEACLAKYGDTLIDYSTVNTAYDMDAIRAALGDEQLSYIGISYGTYLGSVYATLFPDRVRALVLDSAYEPTGDSIEEQYTTQLVGFDEAFGNWVDWCERTTCAFADGTQVAAAWDALRVRLDTTPAPADDGRSANQAVFETATIAALYSESQWGLLAQALVDAEAGRGDKLFVLADSYVGRESDGSYSTIEQSGTIIRCASGIDYDVPDDPQALADELLALSPRFAQGTTADDFSDGCATLMPDVVAPELSYTGDAPILIVGGLNDPATPFRWAEEMTDAMGPSARLLTYTGEGHGQMLNSNCVTDWEARTIVDLELPSPDEVCEPDPPIEQPEWWDTLPVPDGVSGTIDASGVNGLLGLTPSLAFSEVRTSELSPEAVLDGYDTALEPLGWFIGDRAEPIQGVPQGVYFSDDGGVFSVLVFGPDAFASSELEGLDQVADPTKTLVVLLAF
jgi:pimeloyl-ACP methyl ester carboxylesterase